MQPANDGKVGAAFCVVLSTVSTIFLLFCCLKSKIRLVLRHNALTVPYSVAPQRTGHYPHRFFGSVFFGCPFADRVLLVNAARNAVF